MTKLNILIVLIFSTQYLIAQMFTEVNNSPFEGVQYSSVAFADIDGDNDQDVLILGQNNANEPTTKLYLNDGGDFTEVSNTPFEDLVDGSIAFADIDGDNDQDVLITGSKISFSPMAKLYINDGMGNFTEVSNISIVGVRNSSIAFADVDGDNDHDVLITGTSSSLVRTTRLYINDGVGNFEEAANTIFEGVDGSSIAFTDIDQDNDQDVLITGFGVSGSAIAYLYTNDGIGNYSIAFAVQGVFNGSIAFADVNGDDYQDVLITGRPNFPMPLAGKLYINDGSNGLDEMLGTPFEGVEFGSVAFADIDGDNDQDALITGSSFDGRISKIYTNDGNGNFTEVFNTPFEGVLFGSVAFADIDGDNDQDILITGNSESQSTTAKLYINEGMNTSTEDVLSVSNTRFTLYPNPVKNQIINVNFEAKDNTLIHVRIFDANGRVLIHKQRVTSIGEQHFSLNVSTLSKGTYLVELDDGLRLNTKKLLIY